MKISKNQVEVAVSSTRYQETKHAGTLKEAKKILIIGDSHIRRVKSTLMQI